MARPLIDSFRDAGNGFIHVIRTQRNMVIHLIVALLTIIFGWRLGLTAVEFSLIMVCIVMVIAGEIFNTVVETVVDLCTREYHPLAAQAKDMAAAGVLVLSVTAAIIGVIIFGPKLWSLFCR